MMNHLINILKSSRGLRLSNSALRLSRKCLYSTSNGPITGSQVYDLLTELKSMSPEMVDPVKYHQVLDHQLISSNVKRPTKKDVYSVEDMAYLYNLVIKSFAGHDYSIATIARSSLSNLPLELRRPNLEAIIEIIRHNPGRVLSSWEIFIDDIHKDEKTCMLIRASPPLKQELIDLMVDKLLYGDFNDIEDGFKTDIRSLTRISYLLQSYNIELSDLSSKQQTEIMDKAFELQCPWVMGQIGIPSLLARQKIMEGQLSQHEFITLFLKLWEEPMSDYQILLKVLPILAQVSVEGALLNVSEQKTIEEFQSRISQLGLSFEMPSKEQLGEILKQLIANIKLQKLDHGDSFEVLKLQKSLIHSIGVEGKDLTGAEKFFNEYSNDSLNQTISLVYCYHACIQNSSELLIQAETLLQHPIPVQNLQALILTKAYLGKQGDSLKLFNDNIGKLNRTISSNGTSDASLITESLILGYLYNLDREFAYLINDGAVQNNIVEGDAAILRFKELFKCYGKAVEDEEDSKAREMMGLVLINKLKKL